jgi:PIN like domain
MKDIFPEYYQPEGNDFKNLWNDCLFIVDANVLLDLYRYSEESSNDLFEVLESVKIAERLWLPHQVAMEFQRNRVGVIISQKDNFLHLETAFSEGIDKMIQSVREKAENFNRVNKLRKEPLFDIDRLLDSLKTEVDDIEKKLAEEKGKLQDHQNTDLKRERIDKLFSGRVGKRYSKEELVKICEDGKKRFEKSIPPGYADYPEKIKGKNIADNENTYNQFGDLVVWKQIIAKSKEVKRPIIFITGDVKEDWFERVKGKTVGPRPELLREFREESSVNAYIYPIDAFYRYAKEYLEQEIRQETVDEVEAVLEKSNNISHSRDVLLKFFEETTSNVQFKVLLMRAYIQYTPEDHIIKMTFNSTQGIHASNLKSHIQEILKIAQSNFGKNIKIQIVENADNLPQLVTTYNDDGEFMTTSIGVGNDLIDNISKVSKAQVFKSGEVVKHPRFGLGTVVGISGEGVKAEITVIFKEAGAKRLLLNYANLTKL